VKFSKYFSLCYKSDIQYGALFTLKTDLPLKLESSICFKNVHNIL